MKITKSQLAKIIREEISQIIRVNENSTSDYEREILKLKDEFEAAKSNPEKQKKIRSKIDTLYNAYLAANK